MALSVSTTQDFTLYSSTDCLADCTKNDGYCHTECAGVNGCAYPMDTNSDGQTVAEVCNGLGEGWVRPFETGVGVTEVLCAPMLQLLLRNDGNGSCTDSCSS